ncbi:MAG: hypothetical protein HZA20_05055 [Nitrospirae bacterium]|nr:hypothetical protein [Nitrospirota bacterium]
MKRLISLLWLCGALLLSASSAGALDNVHLNAYFDFRVAYDDLQEHNLYMRAHHFGVILNAAEDRTRFYAEIEFEDTPEIRTKDSGINARRTSDDAKIAVEAVWAKYVFDEKLSVTAGQFLTPLSFYQQKHYHILLAGIHRPAGVDNMTDESMLGVQLDGRFAVDNWKMRYFAGAIQDWGTGVNDKDKNDNKPLFVRLEATPPFMPQLAAGVGVMRGRDARYEYDSTNNEWKDADKALLAIDFNYKGEKLFVEGVWHYMTVDPIDANSEDYHAVGTHLLVRCNAGEHVSPWVMAEYADHLDGSDAIVDMRAYTLGLNYNVSEHLVVKTEAMSRHEEGQYGKSFEVSVVVFF